MNQYVVVTRAKFYHYIYVVTANNEDEACDIVHNRFERGEEVIECDLITDDRFHVVAAIRRDSEPI
jgi:2-keto-3-deoxy-6-phosphogluconate aldolase